MAKFENKTERVLAFGEKFSIPGAEPIELTDAEIKIYSVDALVEAKRLSKIIEEVVVDKIDVDNMTVVQLKEYATTNGIDIGDATKKEDILAVIKTAEATK
ncbi:MAG: hypothetical protein K0Q53_80 [Massilibacillus sp.]|jgi:hypothetical protein|nr:hypothetical protein [Massilibacillus sp.]